MEWTKYTAKEALKDNDELMILDKDANANKRTLMDKVWDYVVDKMTTAVIEKLGTTNKTLIGAVNELNSNKFKQIPVNITIENNKLSAQFSIDNTEFGIICLTFAVSSSVYACVLIGYGSTYSANLISANASNASNFKYIVSEKVLTCDVAIQQKDVHDINAFLIK
jgi:hypothetical protein